MEKIRKLRLLEIMLAIIGFFMISPMKVQAVTATPVEYSDSLIFYDSDHWYHQGDFVKHRGDLAFDYTEIYDQYSKPSESYDDNVHTICGEGECVWLHFSPAVTGIYNISSTSVGGDDPVMELFNYNKYGAYYYGALTSFGEKDSQLYRHKFAEVDGGNSNNSYDFEYETILYQGYDYYIRVSGFAQSALTDTVVWLVKMNQYIVEPLTEQVQYVTPTEPAVLNVKCVEFLQPFVFWYYLDEEGNRVNLDFGHGCYLNDNGEYTREFNFGVADVDDNSLSVPYCRELNGKSRTYICCIRQNVNDTKDLGTVEFTVYGEPFDTGLTVHQTPCPEFVLWDSSTILAVTADSSEELTYQWYYQKHSGEFAKIKNAKEPTLTIEAGKYPFNGNVTYRCVVQDSLMECNADFTFEVSNKPYEEHWSIAAEHETMRPGTVNRIYMSTCRSYLTEDTYEWYRWNDTTQEYDLIEGANDYYYTITSAESGSFIYGSTVTYKCRTRYGHSTLYDPPVQEKVQQIFVSALPYGAITEEYYLDYYSGSILINGFNCRSYDSGGDYSYSWTYALEGTSEVHSLQGTGFDLQLTASDLPQGGDYLISCEIHDNTVGKMTRIRSIVHYNRSSLFKVYYDPDVIIDSVNGNDLELILAGRIEEIEQAYYWWGHLERIYDESGRRIHVDPNFFMSNSDAMCNIYSAHASSPMATFRPVETKAEPQGAKSLEEQTPVLDLTGMRVDTSMNYNTNNTVDLSINSGESVAIQIPKISADVRRGVWEIDISNALEMNEFDVALYDSAGYAIPFTSGKANRNMWIRFDRLKRDSYTLVVTNTDLSGFDMTVSAEHHVISTVRDIVVKCGNTEHRLANDYSAVTIDWGGMTGGIKQILVDGVIVAQGGTDLTEFSPNPCYDLDGDDILHITYRIKVAGYWQSAEQTIYLETLLLEDRSGVLGDNLFQFITIPNGEPLELDPLTRLENNYNTIEKQEYVQNLFSTLNCRWYALSSLTDTEISDKTPVSREINYTPDTAVNGTTYYMALLDNGVNSCAVIYKLEVVDRAEITGSEVQVNGLSLSLFDDGNIGLNNYVLIPSSLDLAALTINGESVDSLEKMDDYYGISDTFYCYKFTFLVSAAEMADNFPLEVVDTGSGETLYTSSFAVTDYMDILLHDEYYRSFHPECEKYQELAKALLHYGGAAQEYFNYNVENRADKLVLGDEEADGTYIADIEESDLMSLAPEEGYSDNISSLEGLDYLGSSMVLLSDFSMRFYFRINRDDASLSDFYFGMNDVSLPVEQKGSVLYSEIEHIRIGDLGVDQNVWASTTLIEPYIITGNLHFSGLNYLYLLYQTGKPTSQELAKGLYWYYQNWMNVTGT